MIKYQILILFQRFFLPWTLTRVLFLLIGFSVIYQSIIDQLWIALFFGGYLFFKGIFALGCAGGNCQLNSHLENENVESEIELKEIK
jgi:hypothetical protein